MTRPLKYHSDRETLKQDLSTIKLNNKEENTMTNNTTNRRIVTVTLIDPDKGLPVESSVVAVYTNVVTEDNDSTTIQEILMNKDVAEALASHNKKRQGIINEGILERTGNEVKLRPVKLKDLVWTVQ